MFNLLNPLFITTWCLCMLAVGVGITYGLNVVASEKVGWNRLPQKPDALISKQALASKFAVWRERDRDSPVKGWRESSVDTAWKTSDSKSAVRSWMSLWRVVGKASFEQLRVCLDLPQTKLAGETNRNVVWLHHKSHPYEEQNHDTSMARRTAKMKHHSQP